MILCMSGGLDSYIAYEYLKHPQTVYFDLQTPDSKREIQVIKELVPDTIIEPFPNLGGRMLQPNNYIPYRNLYFAMLASTYSDIVVMAGVKDDVVSDKSPEAFRRFSDLLSDLESKQVIVYSPFWGMTKAEIVKWYLDQYVEGVLTEEEYLEMRIKTLLRTRSCYSGDDTRYCGMCASCFRKWNALWENGVYLEFHNESLMAYYEDRALCEKYIPERNDSIIECIRQYEHPHNKKKEYRKVPELC